ncbi:hypothetical protein Clacol_002931 [Clathrus columnatus]|uniref:Fork-head domain-containing protein n=1 Tax=Clathrus columnatus TaxID=1419009 RepID=A0AAV5A5F2_9AGAM|nr:hypothetical protein Clacol_002931 [Clathrus columnatus]
MSVSSSNEVRRSSFSATPPSREGSVNLSPLHLPFFPSRHPPPSDQRQSLPSVQELHLDLFPSPSSPHLPPIMSSSPHSSAVPPQNDASSTPRTHDSPVEEPVAGPSSSTVLHPVASSSSSSGRLPNRSYYPASYHQHQFDALALHDAPAMEERENLGLNSLDGDLDQAPLYSMPLIIECAILGSPHQRLTLSELRSTLKRRFRYYEKEEEKGVKSWERTLLQNLSKKERFRNAERPEPGQGGYWTINHNAQPPLRVRKRVTRRSIISPQQFIAGTSSSVPGLSGTLHWRPITARIHSRTEQDHSNSAALLLRQPESPRSTSRESRRRQPYNNPKFNTSSSSATRLDTTTITTTTSSSSSTARYIYPPPSQPFHHHSYYNNPTNNNNISGGEIGSTTSLFRSSPTQRTPDGRLRGRHSHSIILPPVTPRPQNEVCSSSPRHWHYSELPPPDE